MDDSLRSEDLEFMNAVIRRVCTNLGYDNWFPDKVNVLSGADGNFMCELTVDQDMANVRGSLHGGCIATLVDMGAIMAVMSLNKNKPKDPLPSGYTVNMNVSYMKTTKLGDEIIIDAKTLKSGKSLAFVNVDIRKKDDGSVIASGKQTMYVDRTPFSYNGRAKCV